MLTLAAAGRPDADLIATRAALLFAVRVPLYNLAGVLLLRQGAESRAGRNSAGRMPATNPLIISCLVGILVSLAGFRIPASLLRTLHAAGGMAIPLTLLAIGAEIDLRLLHRHEVSTLASALIKVDLHPLLGWFFVCGMGLSSGDRLSLSSVSPVQRKCLPTFCVIRWMQMPILRQASSF